jgi:hypothetical protein
MVEIIILVVNYIPRSKITGWFRQESTGNRWNVEAVFPPENFRIFSDDFRTVPAGKHRKLTGIHRKKSNKLPVGILLPLPAISSAFLQDPVTSPLLSCRILRDPVAVIFDLGTEIRNHLKDYLEKLYEVRLFV